MRHWARMEPSRDETGNVRHIGGHDGADTFTGGADSGEVDDAWIRARANHDHLRLMLVGETIDLVIVDPLLVFCDAVRHDLIQLSGEVQRMAVRQMPTMSE